MAPLTGGDTSTAFFDVSSLQVLKGPQGALFGRNATGGAVLYEREWAAESRESGWVVTRVR